MKAKTFDIHVVYVFLISLNNLSFQINRQTIVVGQWKSKKKLKHKSGFFFGLNCDNIVHLSNLHNR
jgi:hypothetical protein